MNAPSPSTAPGPFLDRLKQWLLNWRRNPSELDFSPPATIAALRSGQSRFRHVFTTLGGQLDDIDRQSRQLLDNCEALLELASGRTEGIDLFRESLQTLEQPIAHIDQNIRNLQPMLAALHACEEHVDELLKCQVTLGEVLAPLRHMIVFFKIEAAGLDPEHQATFHTVADEIQRLREMIDQTFEENTQKLRAVHNTLIALQQSVAREYRQHSEKFGIKHREIEQCIEKLGAQLETETSRESRLRDISRSMIGRIGELVSSLQYEDILTQRIEHIVQLLQAGPPKTAPNAWVHLLSGQTTTVTDDLRQGREQIESGLSSFTAQAHELGEAAMMLRQSETSTASIDGMVQLLLDAFAEITAITVENTRLADDTYRAVEPISQVTESLSSVVIDVSLGIQLIALNAQVRSVQIGERTGLEVLAASTAEISSELARLGDRTGQEITTLRDVSSGLLENLRHLRDSGQTNSAKLRTGGASLVDRLHAMRDRTLHTLQNVGQTMETVLARSQDRTELVAALDGAQAQLGHADKLLRDAAERNLPSAAERQVIANTSTAYTMASQREVHARVAGIAAPLEDHDESTTLFFEPAEKPMTVAPKTSAPPVVQAPKTLAASPARSSPPPPRPAAQSAPAAPSPKVALLDDPLGDNCELF